MYEILIFENFRLKLRMSMLKMFSALFYTPIIGQCASMKDKSSV